MLAVRVYHVINLYAKIAIFLIYLVYLNIFFLVGGISLCLKKNTKNNKTVLIGSST